MKINLDRLCKLAGVESTGGALNEASNRSMHDDASVADEADYRFGSGQLAETADADMDEMDHQHMREMEEDMYEDMEEGMYEDDDDQKDEMMARIGEKDMDEMIEVDEAMLVQEIRRARQMIAAAASQRQSEVQSEETLQEAQLRRIVAEEVDSVMKDLNLTSGWVYGDAKPSNSKKGVVNTAFPGIGFKN